MNCLLYFLLLLLGTLPLYAQDDDRPTRIRFGVGGGVGLRQFAPTPTLQNYRTRILSYKGKPEKTGWCGCEYFALNDKGEVKEIFLDEYNAELYARLGIHSQNGNGWLFNAGYLFSRFSYAYVNTPTFNFKGYQLSVRNSDLESNGIVFGVARFWDPSFYVRLSGVYYYRYTTGGFDKPVNSAYTLDYTENGTGFLVNLLDSQKKNLALMPEVGLTSSKHIAELSISATVPLDRYAMTEYYRFYQNRNLTGEATASYSTMTFSLNLRLGFSFFSSHSWAKRIRTPRLKSKPYVPREPSSDSVYPRPAPKPSSPEHDVHRHEPAAPELKNGRFDNLAVRKPIRLLVNFEQSEADLLADSFAELDGLAQWMSTNPTAEIRLEGHTDLIGDAVENLDLSRRRVVTVKDYLSRKGVASGRVEVAWFGESRPLTRNCPPPAYCPENRRVEMIIKKR